MASVMQRHRSSQPLNNLDYNESSRTHDQMPSLADDLSYSGATLGTSVLGEQLADLQRELLGQTSTSGAAAEAEASQTSQLLAPSSSDLDLLGDTVRRDGEGVGGIGSSGDVFDFGGVGEGGLEGEGSSSSIGLLDDPAVLALVGQSSTMESTDYELNLAAQALSSQVGEDASGQYSDLDLSSTGTFQFPELPASLLDQAPEYEYSVHTQANVFDAVQNYDATGEEEAARMFSLDRYDPALLTATHPSTGEDLWKYPTESSGSYGQGQLSEYATFHDSSSMSDYPDPSTAPTSRASDYKQDPMTGGFYSSANSSFLAPVDYPVKRRRESFDSSFAPPHGNVQLISSAYGRPMEQQHLQQQHFYPMQHGNHSYMDERIGQEHPLVPSQGNISRARMASWNGEAPTGHYADDWPPPPAPAPMAGHRLGGGQGVYQHEMNHHNPGQGYAIPLLQQTGSNLMNSAMTARMSTGSSDASGPSAAAATGVQNNQSNNTNNNKNSPSSSAAARNASQNEMINALGNAMDASMESEGVAKCPYPNCTKTFAKNRSYNLKAHLRSHSQLKPFACNHCPRAFSRKHDLERHARVHSGDKPYLCEACGKGFPRSDALRRHWRVEKECGEKAVEIEAGQPLPSLPPGVNTVAAQAKGPIPGMMHMNGPTTTAMSSGGPSVPSHPMGMAAYNNFQQHQVWDGSNNSFAGNYSFQQSDRKRAREDY